MCYYVPLLLFDCIYVFITCNVHIYFVSTSLLCGIGPNYVCLFLMMCLYIHVTVMSIQNYE